jgi:NAD(P)H dehydrogenase (quinone)
MKCLFASILLCLVFLANNNLLAQSSPTVLVTYYSESGNTKAMAEAVVKGVQQVEGVRFVLKPIGEVNQEEILAADAIILGSPVYNANMAPAVQSFINSWPFEDRPLKNKIGAVFVTGGGISIGEEAVMFAMIRAMMIHGMVIIGGDELEAAFGASAITGEAPFDLEEKPAAQFLTKAEGLGKRVSEYILKLHTIGK